MNHSQRCSTGVNGADREIGADCPGDECLGLIVASPKRTDRNPPRAATRSALRYAPWANTTYYSDRFLDSWPTAVAQGQPNRMNALCHRT
jgi:hypothetical protein